MQRKATLRLLDKAEKRIQGLPQTIKGAIYKFQRSFRENPESPGLQLEPLEGHERLYSARVDADHRALLLHAGNRDYILVAVLQRRELDENLDRFQYQINPATGGIEFMDVAEAGPVAADANVSAGAPAPESPGTRDPATPETSRPFFAAYTTDQLRELGVAEALLPLVHKITREEELLGLVEYAPSLTEEVLLALVDGKGYEEVLEEITRPVSTAEPVDTSDYTAALDRPATRVTTKDTDLQEALDDRFSRWKVFLHPTQRKIIKRQYQGPARVSGGPGTGKTIVALHRVNHLVARLPSGRSTEILLTTFNKSLAADLHKRLLELGGQQVVDRVDIVHIDRLANQIVAETSRGNRRRLSESQAVSEWQAMLAELGETRWSAEFLHAEWSQVILGQGINSRADYFRARRAGRGQRISRAQRAQVWQLVERFTMRLDEKRLWTYRQVAKLAARVQSEQAAKIAEYRRREERHGAPMKQHLEQSWANLRYPYRHIVVDEAQDLSPAHWTLLRAMVPEDTDDIFLVGDTHQRIYDNYVSLGNLGVNIRGRSSRLTLSYRTTREILGHALGLLGDEPWDDLDDSTENLTAYRSVLHGPRPQYDGFNTWEDELDGLSRQVAAWQQDDGEPPAIGIAVPTRDMVSQVEQRLRGVGIRAASIGPDGPRVDDAVHVGTLHRFKGLEYRHVIVAGVAEGLVPGRHVERIREGGDTLNYRRELKRVRSLLFVATTRARDSLVISWHDRPSSLLPKVSQRSLEAKRQTTASSQSHDQLSQH